jgi:lactate permease
VVCGACVLLASGGLSLLRRRGNAVLVAGGAMAATLYAAATRGMSPLGSMLASLAGLAVLVLWASLRRTATTEQSAPVEGPEESSAPELPIRWALIPYALLIAIVVAASLVQPVNDLLGRVVLRVQFPKLRTARGWATPAGPGRSIDVFGHAGALLFYASILTYALLRWTGYMPQGAAPSIVRAVIRGGKKSSLGIAAMVGMAATIEHAGMTNLLAEGIAGVAGPLFPLVSPYIGVLGAFMTGSNTNSNVIFGNLQQQVAALVGVDPLIILAAQTTGAAIGSMSAPAKIIVACSTVNLGGKEGETLGETLRYGLVMAGILAVAAAVGVYLIAPS